MAQRIRRTALGGIGLSLLLPALRSNGTEGSRSCQTFLATRSSQSNDASVEEGRSTSLPVGFSPGYIVSETRRYLRRPLRHTIMSDTKQFRYRNERRPTGLPATDALRVWATKKQAIFFVTSACWGMLFLISICCAALRMWASWIRRNHQAREDFPSN